MDRMGHSTACTATVYLHGGDPRQQAIAAELSRLQGVRPDRDSNAGPTA
jgi:hypothetical protein